MNDQKQPYLKLIQIKEVSSTEEANNLIHSGWVYLGFCSRTMTTNLGTTPDQDYQVPTHYLGDPDPDQDL